MTYDIPFRYYFKSFQHGFSGCFPRTTSMISSVFLYNFFFMTPRTDLFDLVHSLTPNEKRYFKLFSSVHGKSKRKMYDILFDTVAAMKYYDEGILKQKLKKYPFA